MRDNDTGFKFFLMHSNVHTGIDISMEEWLLQNLSSGSLIGLDPKYYGKLEWDALQAVLGNRNITLTHVNHTNLVDVDVVWPDRPNCPTDSVRELSIEFAGKPVDAKIQEIYDEMDRERVEFLIVTELDEVACKVLPHLFPFRVKSENFVFKFRATKS